MPWTVKKVKNEYCVFDKSGKQMKCYPDKAAADKYSAALYANAEKNLEHLSASMLEEGGPVIVGVGVTNIPHLPLPPMSVVEEDGQEVIRVPFLRKGVFRHPDGELVFDDKVFDQMLANHSQKISEWGAPLKVGHDTKKTDALGWLDNDEGGRIVKEVDQKYGELLVGYVKPIDEDALKLVKGKKFKYASIEFKPKYQSTLVKQLSAEVLTEIQTDDLLDPIMLEEQKMEVTISQEEYDALKEKAERVTQLEQQLKDTEAKIVTLEAQVKPAKDEVNLPESVKLEMQSQREEISRLKRNALETQVNLILTKAESYRDKNGYGHSPVLLEYAKAAMLGQEVKLAEDKVIKLESAQPADIADYFRKVWVTVLETIPGQVNMTGKTESDDKRSVNLESGSFTADELKSWWAEAV